MSTACKITECLALPRNLGRTGELELGKSGFCKKCLTGYHLVQLKELQRQHNIDEAIMIRDFDKRLQWDHELGLHPCVCDDWRYIGFEWHTRLFLYRMQKLIDSPDEMILRCPGMHATCTVCIHCINLYKPLASVPRHLFFFEPSDDNPFASLKFKCIETIEGYEGWPWRLGNPPFQGCMDYTGAPHSLCALCTAQWRSVLGEIGWSDMFDPGSKVKESYRRGKFISLIWSE
jgi:hypothetical protein